MGKSLHFAAAVCVEWLPSTYGARSARRDKYIYIWGFLRYLQPLLCAVYLPSRWYLVRLLVRRKDNKPGGLQLQQIPTSIALLYMLMLASFST